MVCPIRLTRSDFAPMNTVSNALPPIHGKMNLTRHD
jgi:hypothetical protein